MPNTAMIGAGPNGLLGQTLKSSGLGEKIRENAELTIAKMISLSKVKTRNKDPLGQSNFGCEYLLLADMLGINRRGISSSSSRLSTCS